MWHSGRGRREDCVVEWLPGRSYAAHAIQCICGEQRVHGDIPVAGWNLCDALAFEADADQLRALPLTGQQSVTKIAVVESRATAQSRAALIHRHQRHQDGVQSPALDAWVM